jgi:hypothetical protein
MRAAITVLLGKSLAIVSAMLCLVFVLSLAGCDDPAATRNALEAARAHQVDLYAAALNTGNAAAQKNADTAIKQIDAALTALNASVGPDGKITTDTAITGVTSTVGALLPPPWNVLAILGGAVAAGIVQQVRLNSANATGKSLVNALDAHNIAEPTNAVTTLHPDAVAALTPGAAKLLNSESLTIDTVHAPA